MDRYHTRMAQQANSLISLNPATGNALGFVETGPVGSIANRVQQARDVQAGWAALGPGRRIRMLQHAATLLLASAPRLGTLLSEETGIPRQQGLHEVRSAAHQASKLLELALPALSPVPPSGATQSTIVERDPLGICAVITPWSNPAAIINGLLVPALASGNTVVLKPSPETPLIAQHIVDIYQRFLPEAVLQVVHGGSAHGKALVAANVQLIAFCGTTTVGKHVMSDAAFGLKRLLLALGGKNSAIVLPGADLDAAARFVMESSFGPAPRCLATERVFVDSGIAHDFEQRLVTLSRDYRIGSWDDPNAAIGPMINAQRRSRVIELIEDAQARGAVALTGGGEHPEFFLRPSLLSHVDNGMPIAQQEILGPALCISHIDGAQDAVSAINRSRFAQGAAVFAEPHVAADIARQLDATELGINRGLPMDALPRVGAKHSGWSHAHTDAFAPFTQARRSHLY